MLFAFHALTWVLPGIAGLWAFARLRRYRLAVRVLLSLGCSGLTLLAVWAAILGTLYVALVEPWPLSLRQGPDTAYARTCFERYLGEVPPPDVRDVYCREEWGFGGDSIESVRFHYSHEAVLGRVAAHVGLTRTPGDGRGLRYLRGPAWWPAEPELRALPVYYRLETEEREVFWVDPDRRIAYFQQAGF